MPSSSSPAPARNLAPGADGPRRPDSGDRVRFLGFRTDVPEIPSALDGLVHPRYEAAGLSVHEALCRGLPAIVTACAGVAERYPADLRHCLL
jgi:glycosyltransferase involved in cell wall biosynthesis